MKYEKNLGYRIVVSPEAKLQLRNIIQYVRLVLKNPIAAKRIIEDAKKTMTKLTYLANNLKICEEPELAKYGYRIISFQKHNYIMLFRVDGNTVYVDGVFHQLQNFQELFK